MFNEIEYFIEGINLWIFAVEDIQLSNLKTLHFLNALVWPSTNENHQPAVSKTKLFWRFQDEYCRWSNTGRQRIGRLPVVAFGLGEFILIPGRAEVFLVVIVETTQYIFFKIGFLICPKHIVYL
jgi:hypothetical protein